MGRRGLPGQALRQASICGQEATANGKAKMMVLRSLWHVSLCFVQGQDD